MIETLATVAYVLFLIVGAFALLAILGVNRR